MIADEITRTMLEGHDWQTAMHMGDCITIPGQAPGVYPVRRVARKITKQMAENMTRVSVLRDAAGNAIGHRAVVAE